MLPAQECTCVCDSRAPLAAPGLCHAGAGRHAGVPVARGRGRRRGRARRRPHHVRATHGCCARAPRMAAVLMRHAWLLCTSYCVTSPPSLTSLTHSPLLLLGPGSQVMRWLQWRRQPPHIEVTVTLAAAYLSFYVANAYLAASGEGHEPVGGVGVQLGSLATTSRMARLCEGCTAPRGDNYCTFFIFFPATTLHVWRRRDCGRGVWPVRRGQHDLAHEHQGGVYPHAIASEPFFPFLFSALHSPLPAYTLRPSASKCAQYLA